MLDISVLTKGIEEYEFWFLLTLIVVEIGIDLVSRSKRNYQDTGANIAIAIIYAFTSAIFWQSIFGNLQYSPKNVTSKNY